MRDLPAKRRGCSTTTQPPLVPHPLVLRACSRLSSALYRHPLIRTQQTRWCPNLYFERWDFRSSVGDCVVSSVCRHACVIISYIPPTVELREQGICLFAKWFRRVVPAARRTAGRIVAEVQKIYSRRAQWIADSGQGHHTAREEGRWQRS